MSDILKTNVCCLDLPQDCINYLKSLDLNVYEGSLGSVFLFDWDKEIKNSLNVCSDINIPENLQEYHVIIVDTANHNKREYKGCEHEIRIKSEGERCIICKRPLSVLDLRPLGTQLIDQKLSEINHRKLIEIVFLGDYQEMAYTTTTITTQYSKLSQPVSNYSAWDILSGSKRIGKGHVLPIVEYQKLYSRKGLIK